MTSPPNRIRVLLGGFGRGIVSGGAVRWKGIAARTGSSARRVRIISVSCQHFVENRIGAEDRQFLAHEDFLGEQQHLRAADTATSVYLERRLIGTGNGDLGIAGKNDRSQAAGAVRA